MQVTSVFRSSRGSREARGVPDRGESKGERWLSDTLYESLEVPIGDHLSVRFLTWTVRLPDEKANEVTYSGA